MDSRLCPVAICGDEDHPTDIVLLDHKCGSANPGGSRLSGGSNGRAVYGDTVIPVHCRWVQKRYELLSLVETFSYIYEKNIWAGADRKAPDSSLGPGLTAISLSNMARWRSFDRRSGKSATEGEKAALIWRTFEKLNRFFLPLWIDVSVNRACPVQRVGGSVPVAVTAAGLHAGWPHPLALTPSISPAAVLMS
jgi:hypothetical protein